MVKPAHELWKELNARKYRCEPCCFRSSNKAHWTRHKDTPKHFLINEFVHAPRDIKVLVATFLPIHYLCNIGSIGLFALNRVLAPSVRFVNRRVLHLRSSVGLPSQTVYLGNPLIHSSQIRAFV